MGAQPLLGSKTRQAFPRQARAFGERSATVYALDNVNLDIMEGETLSLVGAIRLRQVDNRLYHPQLLQGDIWQGRLQAGSGPGDAG